MPSAPRYRCQVRAALGLRFPLPAARPHLKSRGGKGQFWGKLSPALPVGDARESCVLEERTRRKRLVGLRFQYSHITSTLADFGRIWPTFFLSSVCRVPPKSGSVMIITFGVEIQPTPTHTNLSNEPLRRASGGLQQGVQGSQAGIHTAASDPSRSCDENGSELLTAQSAGRGSALSPGARKPKGRTPLVM